MMTHRDPLTWKKMVGDSAFITYTVADAMSISHHLPLFKLDTIDVMVERSSISPFSCLVIY